MNGSCSLQNVKDFSKMVNYSCKSNPFIASPAEDISALHAWACLLVRQTVHTNGWSGVDWRSGDEGDELSAVWGGRGWDIQGIPSWRWWVLGRWGQGGDYGRLVVSSLIIFIVLPWQFFLCRALSLQAPVWEAPQSPPQWPLANNLLRNHDGVTRLGSVVF